jgi:hypothetical protein
MGPLIVMVAGLFDIIIIDKDVSFIIVNHPATFSILTYVINKEYQLTPIIEPFRNVL